MKNIKNTLLSLSSLNYARPSQTKAKPYGWNETLELEMVSFLPA